MSKVYASNLCKSRIVFNFCFRKGRAKWLRLGDFDILSKEDDNQDHAQPQEYEITEIIQHPEFRKPNRYNNDIALYKLDRDVVFNEFIRPICLQTDNEFETSAATLTGWFRTGKQFLKSNSPFGLAGGPRPHTPSLGTCF